MSYIFQLFADNQVLLLFFLVGTGAIFSKIRVKGVSLGAAAVLFLSIGVTAWALHSGYEIEVEHDLGVLGLALFAFAIGISSTELFQHPQIFHIARPPHDRSLRNGRWRSCRRRARTWNGLGTHRGNVRRGNDKHTSVIRSWNGIW